MLDHFSHSELACPTTDQVRRAAGFGEALERLRVELDEPIFLNSACRSPTQNAKINGRPRSLHLVINTQRTIGRSQRLNVTVSSSAARCVCAELTFMDVSS